MLGIIAALTIGLALLFSSLFIPSPMAYFIQFLDAYPQLNNIWGHVMWFLPVSRIITTIGSWFEVYGATLLILCIMKLCKII